MRSQIHVRAKEDHLRPSRFRCTSAPRANLLTPLGRSVAPVDQEEAHLSGRREVGRVIHAQHFDTGPGGGLKDPRGDDQIAAEKDDRHSAGAGSGVSGPTGAAGLGGRGRGGAPWKALLDPLAPNPSARYRAMRIG